MKNINYMDTNGKGNIQKIKLFQWEQFFIVKKAVLFQNGWLHEKICGNIIVS